MGQGWDYGLNDFAEELASHQRSHDHLGQLTDLEYPYEAHLFRERPPYERLVLFLQIAGNGYLRFTHPSGVSEEDARQFAHTIVGRADNWTEWASDVRPRR
jgi:hypothetical protein